jgi:hypothetical protein
MIVWDTGTYHSLTEQDGRTVLVERAVQDGHVAVWLEGRKLHGGYALTRIGKGKREHWLLVKMADERADARRKPVKSQPESMVSGRNRCAKAPFLQVTPDRKDRRNVLSSCARAAPLSRKPFCAALPATRYRA